MGNVGICGYFACIARDCPSPAHHRGRDEYTPSAGKTGHEDEEERRGAV
jgi:hypothetical protein